MKRIKCLAWLWASASAAFLICVPVMSTAHAAVVGPLYKVAGTELANGGREEITASQRGLQVFRLGGGTVSITCRRLSLESGAEIIGRGRTQGGTGEEIMVYRECTQSGDGAGCRLEREEVKTNTLETLQGYERRERTGKILTGFKPQGAGTVLATFKFEGICMFGRENALELTAGSTVGIVWFERDQLFSETNEDGRELREAETQGLVDLAGATAMFYEKAEAIEELRVGMRTAGIGTTTYEGDQLVKLRSLRAWGVFT